MGNADKKSQRSPFSCSLARLLLQDPLERTAADSQPPRRLPERDARPHQDARLLPFSYSKVYKTPLSGQLFLLHCGLPWHGNL
jgi:hypothetical protein